MNLTSALDYIVAIAGIAIIVVSFAWNIYEVFIHKSGQHSSDPEHHSEDSAIR